MTNHLDREIPMFPRDVEDTYTFKYLSDATHIDTDNEDYLVEVAKLIAQ